MNYHKKRREAASLFLETSRGKNTYMIPIPSALPPGILAWSPLLGNAVLGDSTCAHSCSPSCPDYSCRCRKLQPGATHGSLDLSSPSSMRATAPQGQIYSRHSDL